MPVLSDLRLAESLVPLRKNRTQVFCEIKDIAHASGGSLFIIKYLNYFFLFFKSVTRIIAAPTTITIAPISRKTVP